MLALAAARTRSGRGGALLRAQQRPRFVPTRLPSWHPTTSQAHICAGCPKVPVKKRVTLTQKTHILFSEKKKKETDERPFLVSTAIDYIVSESKYIPLIFEKSKT